MNEQQNSAVIGEGKLVAKDGLKQLIRTIWSDINALLFNANLDFHPSRLTPDVSMVQFKHLSSR